MGTQSGQSGSGSVMLPPKTCLPRNYSCIAGLFGSLAAATTSPPPGHGDGDGDGEDGDEDGEDFEYPNGNGTVCCEPTESPPVVMMAVVEERPRGREVLLKPPMSPNLRRRCKSLPTSTERAKLEIARSRSPTSQKKVRFADSLGLELTSVKHFDVADLPQVPDRIFAKYSPLSNNDNDNIISSTTNHHHHHPPHHVGTKFPRPLNQSVCMELEFTNPGRLPHFEHKVREVKVLLETFEADEFTLSGVVRVLNLAFEKSVYLRYSLNNWITFMDSLAYYVPDSSDGVTDRFSFKIITPTFMEGGGSTLQFAIRYCVCGEEFWDNNVGNNYKVRRHTLKMSPPREWENGWIHFI